MSRFTLEPGATSGDPSVAKEESTAEVTSPSSKANDGPKQEPSPQTSGPDNLPKEEQQPLSLQPRKLSYAAKKRAKKAAKNAAKQQD